jgi:type I restriction enzyme S subunit
MKDSGLEWIGSIPADWEIRELADLARPGSQVTYGIVQAGPDIEGGIPYIRTSDMSGQQFGPDGYLRTSEAIDSAYARSKVSVGDLVIAIRATVGKALLVPEFLDGANLTQGTAKFSPSVQCNVHYVQHFLNHVAKTEFDMYAKGATFKEITLDRLRRIRVCYPPLDEQDAIVAWLDSELRIISELIQSAEAAATLLQERRSALVSAAVTGKIDVRNYSPRETPSHEEVYEPA